jgi:hypothetical protein
MEARITSNIGNLVKDLRTDFVEEWQNANNCKMCEKFRANLWLRDAGDPTTRTGRGDDDPKKERRRKKHTPQPTTKKPLYHD